MHIEERKRDQKDEHQTIEMGAGVNEQKALYHLKVINLFIAFII